MLIALLCESEMKLADETIEIILDKVKVTSPDKHVQFSFFLVLNFNSDWPIPKCKIDGVKCIVLTDHSGFSRGSLEDYAWFFINFVKANLQYAYSLGA